MGGYRLLQLPRLLELNSIHLDVDFKLTGAYLNTCRKRDPTGNHQCILHKGPSTTITVVGFQRFYQAEVPSAHCANDFSHGRNLLKNRSDFVTNKDSWIKTKPRVVIVGKTNFIAEDIVRLWSMQAQDNTFTLRRLRNQIIDNHCSALITALPPNHSVNITTIKRLVTQCIPTMKQLQAIDFTHQFRKLYQFRERIQYWILGRPFKKISVDTTFKHGQNISDFLDKDNICNINKTSADCLAVKVTIENDSKDDQNQTTSNNTNSLSDDDNQSTSNNSNSLSDDDNQTTTSNTNEASDDENQTTLNNTNALSDDVDIQTQKKPEYTVPADIGRQKIQLEGGTVTVCTQQEWLVDTVYSPKAKESHSVLVPVFADTLSRHIKTRTVMNESIHNPIVLETDGCDKMMSIPKSTAAHCVDYNGIPAQVFNAEKSLELLVYICWKKYKPLSDWLLWFISNINKYQMNTITFILEINH